VESVEWLGMEMVPVWLARPFVVLVMGRPQSTGRTAKLLTMDKVDNQHSVIDDKQRELDHRLLW
jgi:hypothetical protein